MNYNKNKGLLNMIRRTDPMIKEAVSLPARSRISFLVRDRPGDGSLIH